MKSLIALFGLLCICLTVSNVSGAVVGDQRMQIFFEYFRPFWRRHRARIVPYVFANPAPMWRVARSAESEQNDDMEMVACIYAKSKLFCDKNGENVECEVTKNFQNPLLDNFVSFAVTPKKEKQSSIKYNLMPKRMSNVYVNAADFKHKNEANKKYTVVSIHSQDLSNDEGFTVKNEQCWSKMSELLNSAKTTTTVDVEKVSSNDEMWTDKERIIANLLVLD